MKPPKIVSCAVSLAFTGIWLLSGCAHGSGKDIHVSFGVAPLFKVEKDVASAVVDQDIKLVDSSTKVMILSFEYESRAKELTVPNPKAERKP